MTTGPDLALVERFSLAQQWAGYGHDPRADGLHGRVLGAETLADLSESDQQFIHEAAEKALAGESFTMPDGDPLSSWAAQDAEFEARVDGQVAPDTVLPPAEPDPEDITDEEVLAETGDWQDDAEGKGFDFDDPEDVEWVGV